MNILSWQGSKKKELDIIEKYQPLKFDYFIDVFGGGANVSSIYLKKNNIKVIYNDINSDLCELLKTLQDEKKTKNLIEEFNKLKDMQSKDLFYKIYDNEFNISASCKIVYLTISAFRSMIGTRMPNFRDNKMAKLKNIDYFINYPSILKNLTILNKDYKELLEKYKDDENKFLYLDPPYVEKTTKAYNVNFTIKDLIYIRDYMKVCKCKVLLHIDFTGWTYFNFKQYIKFIYPIRYSMSSKKKDIQDIYEKYHVILSNY